MNKKELVKTTKYLNNKNINRGSSGNLSYRTNNGFIITPSSIPNDKLNEKNCVQMAFDGTYKNKLKPSTEWRIHRDIYLKRKDISAIILTNTTNGNRDNLVSEIKKEEGGLSGEPLQQISTNMIKKFYKQLNGKIHIIGVGGVNSGKSAYEKIIAGASLLQLYTGFVYKGPLVAKDIKKELIQILKSEGINNIKEAVGKDV